jgi:LemA protein
MTTLSIILIIIGVVCALVFFWAIGAYNKFVHLKAMVDEAWSGIDVQLKRRYDLIPNLVSVVKGYSIHEKTILEDIARMRAASIGATTVQDKAQAEAGLTQTLKTLFAVAEQYPDLKANVNFVTLQKELSSVEQEVQLARRYYNGSARNYNVSVVTFPSRIIAGLYGFTKVPYFELSAPNEREVPNVKF